MDEPVDQHALAAHNVVAAFADVEMARQALDTLKAEDFDDKKLSLLTRDTSPKADADSAEEPRELGATMMSGATKGGLAGLGLGGAAGFVAGAIAFGIPGIGPAVGAGIWAATAGAAAAGATAGGLVGAFGRMWDAQYRDMVKEGRSLVGVHTGDSDEANRAFGVLEKLSPEHLAHFDAEGAVIHQA